VYHSIINILLLTLKVLAKGNFGQYIWIWFRCYLWIEIPGNRNGRSNGQSRDFRFLKFFYRILLIVLEKEWSLITIYITGSYKPDGISELLKHYHLLLINIVLDERDKERVGRKWNRFYTKITIDIMKDNFKLNLKSYKKLKVRNN
jgi:hypothetical protein